MSYDAYKTSQKLVAEYSFEAIIMAYMREADDIALSFLKSKHPDVWEELKTRYNAPGGKFKGE